MSSCNGPTPKTISASPPGHCSAALILHKRWLVLREDLRTYSSLLSVFGVKRVPPLVIYYYKDWFICLHLTNGVKGLTKPQSYWKHWKTHYIMNVLKESIYLLTHFLEYKQHKDGAYFSFTDISLENISYSILVVSSSAWARLNWVRVSFTCQQNQK